MDTICTNSPNISVIIPVYKAEKYLPECIESILVQTYSDFELILVDDGSPDCCPAICDAYAQKDSRVKVIHKQNGGVSRARNTGLDNASGTFIMFVDSDDHIAPTMLQAMLSHMDDSIDCVLSGLYYFYPDETRNHAYCLPDATVHMPEDFNKYFQDLLHAYGNYTSCAKLFRRSILLTNKIHFEEDYAFLEDATFVSRFLHHCRKCRFMSEAFYYYRQSEEESLIKKFHTNADGALVVYYANSIWMKECLDSENWRTFQDIIDACQIQFITQIYSCAQFNLREKLSTLKRFATTFREKKLCQEMKKSPLIYLLCRFCLNSGAVRLLHWCMLARSILKKL